MPTTTGTEPQTCSVCGRGILKGEQTYDYATPAGELRDVCALCRPSAERVGWLPPSRVQSTPQVRRDRRRSRLGGLIARREISSTVKRRTSHQRHERDTPAEEPAAPAAPQEPADPITHGLSVFNAGSMPRLIAGLTRSLGPAQAEVRQTGTGGILVTVAWELSWYSWEVAASEVREVGKGAEVSEREGPEPRWNARVGEDGRLTVLDGG